MDENIEYSTILIELDALLDVRLSTILAVDDSKLEEIITNDYHQRDEDVFNVDMVRYKELYNNRDKKLLLESMVTPMMSLLKEFAQKTLKQLVTTPYHYQPKIILNTHPYNLDDDEVGILIEALRHGTRGLADIELVSLSYDEISPTYLNDSIAIYIVYEYYKWLEVQSLNGNLKTKTCPKVTMLAPAIYFKKKEQNNTNINPFEAMCTLAAPMIGLNLLPIENFSAILGKQTS